MSSTVISVILLAALALYVLLLLSATVAGYLLAKRWYQKSKQWIGGVIGFLVIFLPVFWDAVPTLVTYEWYCRTEAGFHPHKTLEQWKRENPGAEGAIQPRPANSKVQSSERLIQYDLNSRFRRETRSAERAWGISTRDERLVDSRTSEVIGRFVDFNTGISSRLANGIRSLRDVKFWMVRERCVEGREASGLSSFAALVDEFEALAGPRSAK